jgi:hypothetical protein
MQAVTAKLNREYSPGLMANARAVISSCISNRSARALL